MNTFQACHRGQCSCLICLCTNVPNSISDDLRAERPSIMDMGDQPMTSGNNNFALSVIQGMLFGHATMGARCLVFTDTAWRIQYFKLKYWILHAVWGQNISIIPCFFTWNYIVFYCYCYGISKSNIESCFTWPVLQTTISWANTSCWYLKWCFYMLEHCIWFSICCWTL